MQRIFVDTGGWYAAIAQKDHDHDAAKQFLLTNTLPLITSDYIMDETVTLLSSRIGHNYAVNFTDAPESSRRGTARWVSSWPRGRTPADH